MTARRWTVAACLLYAALSVLCFASHDVEALRAVVRRWWSYVWLLGPPATLLYQWQYVIPYLVGTVVVFASVLATYHLVRRSSAWLLVPGLLAVGAWVLSGALAYAPTF